MGHGDSRSLKAFALNGLAVGKCVPPSPRALPPLGTGTTRATISSPMPRCRAFQIFADARSNNRKDLAEGGLPGRRLKTPDAWSTQIATFSTRRPAFSSAEYSPVFQLAFRDRSNPSAVRGPVLIPPCIRQRPFRMAGL